MSIAMESCFSFIASQWLDELVVTSAGNSSEIWWEITKDTDQTFYLEASMSLSTMFAAGIAMNYPEARIWGFLGDGALIMNTGLLFVERDLSLTNMVSIVVANGCYGATESADLPGGATNDFAAIARAAGIKNVFHFNEASDLERRFGEAFRGSGPTFVVLELDAPTRHHESPPFDGPELKYRFGRALERRFGRRILP